MAWVRFDDGFFRHPKVVAAGRDARDMYTSSIFYANQNLTDGFVPEGALRIIAADAGVSSHNKAVKALLREGLWLEAEGGYEIHDYLDYQVSAASVAASRSANRKRQEEWRNRNRNAKSNAVTNNPVTDTDKYKDINNTTSDEVVKTPKPPRPKPAKPKPAENTAPSGTEGGEHPFTLFEAMCEQLGVEPAAVPERDKGKQLAVAKRLAKSGTSRADVVSITRWLTSQDWRTGGIDMFLLEKEHGKWVLNGKPETSQSSQKKATGHVNQAAMLREQAIRERAEYEQARRDGGSGNTELRLAEPSDNTRDAAGVLVDFSRRTI